MSKKIFIAILTVAILLTTCACSNQQKPTADAGKTTSSTTVSTTSQKADDAVAQSQEQTSTSSKTEKTEVSTSKTKKDALVSTSVKAKDSGSFRYKGKDLKIGMKVTDSLIKSLGQPLDIQNAPSCHYDGNDTIYCYDGFSIYTYANNGADIIYIIELNEANVATSLGAKVGMSVADVKNKYGKSTSQAGSTFEYNISSTAKLSFTYSGDTITLIEYVEK